MKRRKATVEKETKRDSQLHWQREHAHSLCLRQLIS